jgi:hypothetical protein
MGVNQNWAFDPNKTKHLGPLFNYIDYETTSGTSGILIIGKSKFKLDKPQLKTLNTDLKNSRIRNFRGIDLTEAESNKLINTVNLAFKNNLKREKLGLQ